MAVHRPPCDQVERDRCIRVVAYARVNGAPADQIRLLRLQWERMRRFVREPAGWTIIGERALEEAVAGNCSVFLVDSLDRLSRRTSEFAAALEELRNAGVALSSATESFADHNPDGLSTLQTRVALAQSESVGRHHKRAVGFDSREAVDA